jgi:hypothetical protein
MAGCPDLHLSLSEWRHKHTLAMKASTYARLRREAGMTSDQHLACDALSIAGGGFAKVLGCEVELPGPRHFHLNGDGSVVDKATGELHHYDRAGHEFRPPIPRRDPA